MWRTKNGVAVVGSFRGIKDGIETILAKEGTSSAQRAILEELRTVARASDWDFLTLKRTLLRKSRLSKQSSLPS
jgi:hypothetical protein